MAQEGQELGVQIPSQLRNVPELVLEDYVRARLMQFCPPFATRIFPKVTREQIQAAALETLHSLPPPQYGPYVGDLQLVFRHDCQSHGCLDLQCVLCEHNPQRRCSVNFAPKYLVNDTLTAKCDAPIRIEVIDRTTGIPVNEEIHGVNIELYILDGAQYDQRCSERPGEDLGDDLESIALLLNNKATALLVPGAGGTLNESNKVIVPLVGSSAQLPELHITDSSEALLSGRKPPFRLLARAVPASETKPIPNIRSAVSEGFVVATRRTRTAGKAEIPNVEDHIGKLEHMGRETVKKLADLRASAAAVGVDIQVPDNRVAKVGEFRKLALLAEADGHLRQKLQQVLKLSKEKWDEARDHAMRAVVADNRMRIWYADKGSMEVGLLFTCRLGSVELDRPVGLLTKKASDGAQTTMEATLMAQQTPAQREQVRGLQPQAAASWWHHGHPGWAIYPVDSDRFLETGTLDAGSGPPRAAVPAPIDPAVAAANFAFQTNPFLPGAGLPHGLPAGESNEALMRAFMGGFGAMPNPLMPPSVAAIANGPESPNAADASPFSAFAVGAQAMPPPSPRGGGGRGRQQTQHAQQQRNGLPADQVHQQNNNKRPRDPSPPKFLGAPSLDGAPSFALGNLQSLFGSDFKLPFGLQNFPSLPGGGLLPGSGDLEALLAQAGGDPLFTGGAVRLPSLMLGKSMELPDGVITTGTAPGGIEPKHDANGVPRPSMQRKASRLEGMMSIEIELAGSGRPQSPDEAMDAAIAAVRQEKQQKITGNKRK